MDALRNLATFETVVGGVVFVQRRRTTGNMLAVGDARKVFGLIAGANSDKEPTVDERNEAKAEYIEMGRKSLELNLVSVDGEEIDVAASWADLEPVADLLFNAYLGSGLQVDPTPESSKGVMDSK